MRSFFNLLLKVFRSRYLIQVMATREIKLRYTGSAIGVFWAVVHPLIMVVLYWFIFSLGLKLQPSGNIPFVVWFFCAFTPWATFNEMLMAVTPSVVTNRALIKRTLFPSEIFPFIYIVSSALSHVIMLVILVVMLLVNGIPLTLYAFQFLYYWFAMMCLMIGLGWLFAAVNAAFRDMGQLVVVILQIWFWVTPVIWSLEMLPEKFHFFLQLNPMYYITQGYRDAFIQHYPIWHDLRTGMVFWLQTLVIFIMGGMIFRKFKREFADML